jgi:hypothetical protein
VFEADRLEDSLVLDPVMDGRIYIEIMVIRGRKESWRYSISFGSHYFLHYIARFNVCVFLRLGNESQAILHTYIMVFSFSESMMRCSNAIPQN